MLDLYPNETVRTGQQEIDYKQVHIDSGAKPRVNPPGTGCKPQNEQHLDPQSPAEIDRNKAARAKIKALKAVAAVAAKAAKAGKGKSTTKTTQTGKSDSPDDDAEMADEADETFGLEEADEPVIEYEKWVPPEVDDEHYWPDEDAYDGMNSDDELT